MIKFRIHFSLGEEEAQIWEVLEKCQNCRFLDMFWDILKKMKNYLGQECKRGTLYPFRAKLKQFP